MSERKQKYHYKTRKLIYNSGENPMTVTATFYENY
jgi:hypothetical protein